MIVLITGGTGSFGRAFTRLLLSQSDVRMVRIFSRDEHKQREMRSEFRDNRISYFIGDVRDRERLEQAMNGCDWVVHAAALKQAPVGEIEPQEFIKTNINGSINVVEAARWCRVRKALLISSDKAVEPINLYGATKMCAERVFLDADRMQFQSLPDGSKSTYFACTRYGNVAETAGSVIPLFQSLPWDAPTPITDIRATRFWISLEDATAFVLKSLREMRGGEVFIPKLKSVRIVDIAKAVRPDHEIDVIGLRPGDKLHEVLSVNGTRYSSDQNDFMTVEEIRGYVIGIKSAVA